MRSLLGTDGAAPFPHLSQPGELMKDRADKVQDAVSFPSEGREVSQNWCWGRMMMFWLPPKIKEARGTRWCQAKLPPAAPRGLPHPKSWAVLDYLQLVSLALPRLLAAWQCHPVLQQWWNKKSPDFFSKFFSNSQSPCLQNSKVVAFSQSSSQSFLLYLKQV